MIIFKASDAIVNKDLVIDNNNDDEVPHQTEAQFSVDDLLQITAPNCDEIDTSEIENEAGEVEQVPFGNQKVKECGLKKWFWACEHFSSWNENFFK